MHHATLTNTWMLRKRLNLKRRFELGFFTNTASPEDDAMPFYSSSSTSITSSDDDDSEIIITHSNDFTISDDDEDESSSIASKSLFLSHTLLMMWNLDGAKRFIQSLRIRLEQDFNDESIA